MDEAPLAFPVFSQVGVIDLQRVEVLKGPQGTLYGENSTGGAVNYIAAKPTDSFDAGGQVSYGRFSAVEADGFVSGPLTDTVKARVAVRTDQAGDWQYSYTRDATLGAVNKTAARAILEWDANSALTLSLTLDGWVDRSDTQAYQYQSTACSVPAHCSPALLHYPVAPDNARAADWSPGWPMDKNDHFVQTVFRGDYKISDDLSLTSISGYQEFGERKYFDEDATALTDLDNLVTGQIHSFNQELRLSGEAPRLHWLFGGYYTKVETEEFFSVKAKDSSIADVFPGIIPPLTDSSAKFTQDIQSYAAFGNLEFDLTSNLKFISGLRYTESKRDFTGCNVSIADGILGETFSFLSAALRGTTPVPIPFGGCVTLNATTLLPALYTGRLDQDNTSFREGLDYKLSNGGLLYASVSRGYKSGSFPNVSASTSAQYVPVTQESVLAYEVGTKLPLLGRKLEFETSAFYYNYTNKQIRGRILDPIFGSLEVLVNIPKSRVWGLEGSLLARPFEGLELNLSATYVNSLVQRYVGITPAGTTENFAGSPFPYTPKIQAVADLQYKWPFIGSYDAFVGGDLTYHSNSYAVLGTDPTFRLDPYAVLDLRAGMEPRGGPWRVSAFVQNATNKYYWNNYFQFIDTSFRQAAMPITYGLTFAWKYR